MQRVLPHDLMGVVEISEGGDRIRVHAGAGSGRATQAYEVAVPNPQLLMDGLGGKNRLWRLYYRQFCGGKKSNTTQDRRKLLSFENSGLGDPVSTFCRSNLRPTSPT